MFPFPPKLQSFNVAIKIIVYIFVFSMFCPSFMQTVIIFVCGHIAALMLIYFNLMKSHVMLFWPKSIVFNFLHVLMLIYKVFVDYFSKYQFWSGACCILFFYLKLKYIFVRGLYLPSPSVLHFNTLCYINKILMAIIKLRN